LLANEFISYDEDREDSNVYGADEKPHEVSVKLMGIIHSLLRIVAPESIGMNLPRGK